MVQKRRKSVFVLAFIKFVIFFKCVVLNGKCGVKYNCIVTWYSSRENLILWCKAKKKKCLTQREIIHLLLSCSLTVYDNLIKNSRLFFFVFFCLSLFFVVYCCCCFFFFFFWQWANMLHLVWGHIRQHSIHLLPIVPETDA